jgi:acyl transferase domain-containing protein/NAD(P)-dependent dehydrogenase (short-subunit alcohol dehydrogenase family)/aryl carrier-like protein
VTDPTSDSPDYRALLKRSLGAIQQLEAKLDAVEQSRAEPIAIVGIGCRFPGGVVDPESYWELLRNGVDAVTEVPPDRWNIADIYDADPDAVGKSYTKWGGFLDGVDKFDALFFGISPREAPSMDPQHRVLLEVVWEALENASIAPPSLAGSRTAVFLGVSTHDYQNEFSEVVGLSYADAYAGSGAAHAVASGRVAYFLGLHGPNAPIDTACSSSSVAIHLAAQSLRLAESNVALAAGVNLTLTASGSIITSRARMMSFDGRCKTFDISADGYVRSEGVGVLVLKRLSDARRDGDRILGLIRGSAVNQDGRSSGLTAPNGVAQAAVIRDALANARLNPDDIDVIEAHGTGTSLGDPIEMNALGKVFGQRDAEHPLFVGSVKTNIGHTEGSAGIAGVIKTVLALQHKQIPPHLHFKTPNPLIPWSTLPIKVPQHLTPWIAQEGKPRRAGVSAFGFSGTNTHIILEEAPAASTEATSDRSAPDAPELLVLSAQTPAALRAGTQRLRDYLRRSDAASLRDVAFTAGVGRAHFAERLAVVARDRATAAERLDAFLSDVEGKRESAVAHGRAPAGTSPEVAFLFTGQGAQRFGMARDLYATEPVFQTALDACAAVIDPIVSRSLVDVMFRDESMRDLLDDTAFTQPALFAVEYALSQLWRSWGVEPTMMMGHSVGEYVAACIAGVFSLDDAARLIAHRGRLMSALPRDGAMVAVFADRERVTRALVGFEADVSIGAANGPTNTVIAGRATAVEKILEMLATDGIEFQRLNVSHAFHSPLMDPMLDEFERIAATVQFSPPKIGVVSNVTGRIAGPEIATAGYWRRHVRAPVLFVDGVETLLAEGMRTFVEVGPSPTLSRMAQRCAGADAAVWLTSLRKERNDAAAMRDTLAQLYVRGQTIDWTALRTPGAQRVSLPTYAFQRERFWHDLTPRRGSRRRLLGGRETNHPLLGTRLAGPLHIYQGSLSVTDEPWLADHQILDLTLFPATGFLELALAAARRAVSEDVHLEDVVIRERLVVPDDRSVATQVIVTTDADGTHTVDVYSAEALEGDADASPEQWRRHATATVVAGVAEIPATPKRDLAGERTVCDVDAHYSQLEERGARYGPAFQGIRKLTRSGAELIARIELPRDLVSDASSVHLHPALLDACLQVVGAGMSGDGVSVPVAVDRIDVFKSGVADAWCYVTIEPTLPNASSVRTNLVLFDDDDAVIAEVRGLVFHRVTREALDRRPSASVRNDWLYDVQWQAAPLTSSPVRGQWILVGDDTSASPLATRLRSDGASVVTVSHDRTALDSALRDSARSLQGVVLVLDPQFGSAAADLTTLKATHAEQIDALLHVVPAIAESGARLWIVTHGSQSVADSVPDLRSAPAWGFGGVVASEYPALRVVRIDLDPGRSFTDNVDLLAASLSWNDAEDRVALRGGNRYVARLTAGTLVPPEREQPRRLEITTRGVLENLVLAPMDRVPPARGEIEIRVVATGLNFRDVLNALGMYPGDPGPLGNECSGVVSAVGEGVEDFVVGDEVITMIDRSFATYVNAPAALTVRKPPSLTFVEAATIPVTFLTAEYALVHLGRLKAGDRVLIHAATGGVGMAATQIARRIGAEIFGTAGSPAKRDLARRLGVHHTSDSRSLSFAPDVRRDSVGEGVDVVLNSLAADFIPESLRLLRSGGRFIEIGKTGIWDAKTVGEQFPGVEYFPLYLGEIAASDPKLVRAMLQRIVDDMAAGVLTPLPATIYPFERSEAAFRFMGQGRHVGKIVITQRLRPEIRSDATYLVTGGLGGLGLACARFLADEGARSLVLAGRRRPTGDAKALIEEMERRGVTVTVASIDVSREEDVAGLVEQIAKTLPPLRGVLHAAGVVDDGVISEQSLGRFERVMAPKVDGTWHLHTRTRHLQIDFFVLFSSGAALLGSPGQSNYAAANAFMDSLAFVREAEGRPALSVNWGSWADVGMVSEVGEQHRRRWAEQGLRMIRPAEGVRMLHDTLRGMLVPNVAILPLDRRRLPSSLGPFFERLTTAGPVTRTREITGTELARRIADASHGERPALLTTFLTDQITRVLAIDRATPLPVDVSVMEMGLDSLMAMELRNRVHTALQVRLSVADLLAGPTVTELVATIGNVMGADAPPRETESTSGDKHVDQLSDAEVDAALAALLAEEKT